MFINKIDVKYMRLVVLLIFICSSNIRAAASSNVPIRIHLNQNVDLIDYSNVALPQVGVDCGLHALKNAIALFNYITGAIDIQERDKQLKSQSIGHIPTMAACRIAVGESGGTLLDPEAIRDLAGQLQYPENVPYANNKLLILDNLSSIQVMRTNEEIKQLADTAEKMRSGALFVQAFILGNMNEGRNASGHWVSAVLARHEQAGPTMLYMANSGGASGIDFDVAMANQLLAFLSSFYLNRLNAIKAIFEIIEDNLKEARYSAVLKDADNLIQTALSFRMLNNSDLSEKFDQLQETISLIQDEDLSAEDKNLKETLLAKLAKRDDLQDEYLGIALLHEFSPVQKEENFRERADGGAASSSQQKQPDDEVIEPFPAHYMEKFYADFFSRSRIEAFAKNSSNVARLRATANKNSENEKYRTLVEELDDVQNDRMTHREIISQVGNIVKNPAYVEHLLKTPIFVPRFARAHENRPTVESETLRKALVQGLEDYKTVTPDYEKKRALINALIATDNARQPELLQLPAAPAVELLSDAEMMNYFRRFFNRAVIERALANKELVARIVATAQNSPGNSTYAAVAEELDDVQNDRITHREIVSQVENIVKNPTYVAHLLKTPVFVPRFARAHEHKLTEASEILRQRLVQGLEDYKAVTPDYEAKKNVIDSLSPFAG